jgi:hypothetical protein
MKKITLIAAFLIAVFSYGQTLSGFVANPSFEDGSVGTMVRNITFNDWKLGGGSSGNTGVSASIQTTNVHAGDGSNALEVTSEYTGAGGEWNVRLINTTYPFDGNNTDSIEVTVAFWAKTTDVDPASMNASGDMRILIKDTGSSNIGDKTNRVLLETDTWIYITKTFTFDPATDYNLSLYFEFGKVDGTTQIDGITTSVTGGATLDDSSEPDEETLNGFVANPSFDDGSAATMVNYNTTDNWRLAGNNGAIAGNSASIQAANIHAGDGSNALEVTNIANAGEWNIKVTGTTYPFDGDNTNATVATVSFWAKTTDVDPDSENASGDFKFTVEDAVSGAVKSNRAILTTDTWVYITKSFTFDEAPSYSLSLSLQFGRLVGVTQIDGITSSVTGGASLVTGITWNGSTNNDWNTTTNWTPERVPTATEEAIIPAGLTNYPTSQSAVDINSVTIANGSSLIANSTFSGNVTYTRNLATTNWYLVSSPVIGQDIDTFASAVGLASGTNNNMGLAPYDNTSFAWSFYQSDDTGTGDFTLGSGISIKLASEGDISFTGTMPVDNVSIATTNGYNLLGNPYPSYININDILNTNNASLFEGTLWLWDQATDSYDTFNLVTPVSYISPAQGFFVRTSGSNTLSITEAMQSHQTADTFQRLSNERPEIRLVLSDGENTRDTDIYYIDGATTGFDNGYDSTTFGGVANSFSIYTHLVANSNGEDYAIQSLPNSDLDTMIVPIGITAATGEQLSISANGVNLPEGFNIYLEDTNDNSFTLLDSTSAFSTTHYEDLNGIGRFYIHTTATALSDNQLSLTNVSIYIVDNNLTITGVHNDNASVRVYDLIGKEVVNTTFEGKGLNKIELPILNTGVYVVQLETQTEAVNKKIIIKN